MNNTFNKELKAYFKQIKKNLNCGFCLKQGFIAQIKEDVAGFIAEHNLHDVTMNDICSNFGTPDEIAKSFDNVVDVKSLKEKSQKLLLAEAITIMLALAAIVLLIIVAYAIYADSLINITVDNNF